MEIRCRCTGCSAKFKVDAKYAGKKARCPKCQAIVEVPLSGGEETVTVPTVVGPAPSSLAPTIPAPTASATSKLARPKQVPTTVAIPVVKGAIPEATTSPEASQAVSAPRTTPAAESSFPSFATVTPSPSSTATGQAHPPRGRKKASLLPLYIGGALTAVVAVTAVALLFALGSGGTTTANKWKSGTASKSTAADDGTLLLDWPPGERSGGAVVIDGQRRAVPAAGTIKFPLAPGEHKVVALRRGFEPFDTTFKVLAGQSTTIAPVWKESTAVDPPAPRGFPIPPAISVAGFDGWPQNYEQAKRAAAAAKKDLLLVFGCSDNDPGTQDLARNLNEAGVLQSHVCVVLDFPDTTRGLDVVADQGQNHLLAEEFGVRSLPTLALADEQGRAYFLKRDWSDGFGAMPSKIAEWSKLKTERDELLAAVGQAADKEHLEAAAKVVKWLQEKSVVRSHAAQIGDWLQQAERSDANNQHGLLEVFFEPQWLLDLSGIQGDDLSRATAVIGKIDPWAARKFQNPDRGAKLHMTAAIVLARMEQFDKATKQLELASQYKPIDPELVSAVDELKRQLAMRELLGTGTGFLISSDGYVLTNHHVIEGDGQVEVRLPGQTETLATKVIAFDAGRDIALLKVTLPPDSAYRPLSVTIGKLGDGSPIATFGHPYGDALGTGIKTTVGAVSAMPPAHKDNMYLLDLRVNSGNSGGPLCDAYGNVVGMVSAKVLIGEIGDSYALAIPAEDLLQFLEKELPADTPLASAAPSEKPLDWPTVRAQVESGVLMVLNKKK